MFSQRHYCYRKTQTGVSHINSNSLPDPEKGLSEIDPRLHANQAKPDRSQHQLLAKWCICSIEIFDSSSIYSSLSWQQYVSI